MEYLSYPQQSAMQMLDTCAGLTMMQELRSATASFLADRSNDGTYVATIEDIEELQEATAMFLAEHANGDCCCLGPVGIGLLLPDEQSLLPITDAVNRVRGAALAASDLINLINESVDAGWVYEDAMHISLPDVTVTELTPRAALSRPLHLVSTCDFVEDQSVLQQERYDAIDDLLGQRADIDSSADKPNDTDSDSTDDRMNKALNQNGQAFDASDIACRFKASKAVAFFDPVADTVVPYVSFDQILKIELTPPTAHLTDRASLKVVTRLPTILEEEVQWSTASDASTDFADRRGFLKSIEPRRQNFLDDDEELDDVDGLHDEHGLASHKSCVEDFDGFFSNDIWINAPDLDLALPVREPFFPQLVEEADNELL